MRLFKVMTRRELFNMKSGKTIGSLPSRLMREDSDVPMRLRREMSI